MKVYDSLSESHCNLPSSASTSFSTSNKGTAWYICGPTVYDSAHLGHGRTYVSMDILRRVALNLHNGNNGTNKSLDTSSRQITPRPLYVMNITDVDDKIIQRSMENSKSNTKDSKNEVDPLALARHYENEFWSDMKLLNVMKPDVICRVSEHVTDTIVPYIQQIVDGGMAYVIPEEDDGEGKVGDNERNETQQGSVYFDVRAFESITNGRTKYGKLAPDVASTDFFTWEESSQPNEEGEVAQECSVNDQEDDESQLIRKKRDPRDFCLWKYRSRSSSSPTAIVEPLSVSYNSPWGPGRPGWHVECSAMIQQLSLDFNKTHTFQIHAGGVDLKFPHHSNEIAQSEAYIASCSGSSCSSWPNDDEEFKEWIPHWIHTGHLYVKGRKMSKSLKNFITIREMLGISSTEGDDTSTTAVTNQTNNVWSSPADDFRLWCLGLSGSYRGPATYSKDRMDEARVIREKWILFLIEGQECLDRLQSKDDNVTDTAMISSSSRLWGDEELQLFHTVTQCSMTCRRALLDDLNGALFVKELTSIADTGLAYVEQVKMNRHTNNRPEEPLRFVLDTLRGQLDLVGFTERTVDAGISTRDSDNSQQSTNSTLVDETVAFRASVRSAALSVLRKKTDGVDSAKDILGLCDKLRDDTFPKLGIEILDGKVVEKNDDSDSNMRWRHCSPTE